MRIKDTELPQIASGVHMLRTGSTRFGSNIYFVESGTGWVLVDTGWPGALQPIIAAAQLLFGPSVPPAAIVLTHIHPDHSGSLPELALRWEVPVYVHTAEMPQAQGKLLDEYANPLDRWILRPLMRLLPPGTMQGTDLTEIVRAFDSAVPELPDWQVVPTSGHTPGHVAFFREDDGVLLSGDAVLTVDMNSPTGLLTGASQVGGPPWITTWDRPAAESSIVALASLKPRVLASGHGPPLIGAEVTSKLSEFAARFHRAGHPQPGPDYRRVAAVRPGGPEMLRVTHRKLRSPRRQEVRVRVETSNVSTVDVQARQGFTTTPLNFPLVPGYAVVGEVDAVGQGVNTVNPGDRVVVLTETGGYSEYVFVHHHPMMKIPAHFDPAEAVVVALNYLVAHQTLSRVARIRPRQTIVITGAAGGVGTALVQLGRLLHLTIYGVEISSKHPWLSAQGVVPLDERAEDAVATLQRLEPEGVDVVLDGLGGTWVEHGLSVLGPRGVLVEYANPGSRTALGQLLRRVLRQRVRPGGPRISLYGTSSWRLNRKPLLGAWATLYQLLEERKIEPVIAGRFPLVDAAKAHARIEQGDVIGSLVLDVSTSNEPRASRPDV